MHIAKTAGSYVNAVFESALGSEACIFHAEARKSLSDDLKSLVSSNLAFVSGHIYQPKWDAFFCDCGVRPIKISAIRDPIEHIASHILWLDHYTAVGNEKEYRALSPSIRRLADAVAATDLSNPGSLDHFLTHLSPVGVQHLDNCQSRYFLVGGESTLHFFEEL